MKKNLIISLKLLLYLTIITGVIYPVLMTIISNAVFPNQSAGSMIEEQGKVLGSELIGQSFDSAIYFTPRPSAISYNPAPSGGTNQGPINAVLKDSVEQRRKRYIEVNGLTEGTHVPEDALFASASGVDPHISVENANLQLNRIAKSRNFDENKRTELKELINRLIEKPQFGILGEERINVLKLNIQLDKL
jgi:K+-transporting ATPase ATPase C chain